MRIFVIAAAVVIAALGLAGRATAQYVMQPGDVSGPGWYYSPQYGYMRNPFNPTPPLVGPEFQNNRYTYREFRTGMYGGTYGPGVYGGNGYVSPGVVGGTFGPGVFSGNGYPGMYGGTYGPGVNRYGWRTYGPRP
jgi:hypothetical protein